MKFKTHNTCNTPKIILITLKLINISDYAGAIIGGVVGGIILIGIIVSIVVIVKCCRRDRSQGYVHNNGARGFIHSTLTEVNPAHTNYPSAVVSPYGWGR